MALKDRIVEIAYRLKDDFSAKVSGVTGAFKKVDAAAEKSSKKVGLLPGAFDRAGRSAKAAGLAIKATLVGALLSVVAVVGRAVAGFGDFRRELDASAKTARSLGETTENVTALEYAAELSGLAMRQLHKGLQQMVRVSSEAADGVGRSAQAVEELGLNAEQLENLSPTEQLKLIAEAMGDIGNQADKVRLAEAIFGARNATGFLNLLERGSQGIEQMTQAAKDLGLTVNDKQAANIERFNDNLATTSARFDALTKGIKLDLMKRASDIIEFFGGGVDLTPLQKINKRIGEIRARMHKLQTEGADFHLFGGLNAKSELMLLQQQLDQVLEKRRDLMRADEEEQMQAKQRAQEREHNRKLAAIRNEGTEALKKTLAERRKEYQKNIADLARLKNEEKSIAKEFAAFVAEIQSGPGASGTPDIIDTSKARLDAQTALNQGDFDTAIEKARQAADMLRQMKEAGAESNIVLTGLAKQIERIANESAQGKVNAKQGLIAKQKKQIDEVAKAIENLPKAKISIDEDALRAELQRLQQLLNQRPLEVPVKPRESVAGWNSDIRSMADALQRSQWSDL